jgi:hypothetical protein
MDILCLRIKLTDPWLHSNHPTAHDSGAVVLLAHTHIESGSLCRQSTCCKIPLSKVLGELWSPMAPIATPLSRVFFTYSSEDWRYPSLCIWSCRRPWHKCTAINRSCRSFIVYTYSMPLQFPKGSGLSACRAQHDSHSFCCNISRLIADEYDEWEIQWTPYNHAG